MSLSITVLLIDDEVTYVEYLAKVLNRRGMKVKYAFDGLSALKILEQETFDVIVLDMRMPGMDGIAVLEQIRTKDTLTPVILLSGHADVAKATAAMKGGAADFLLKPCAVETLVSVLEDAAERKSYAAKVP
jgi:DNA-binding NtrC family response regulator